MVVASIKDEVMLIDDGVMLFSIMLRIMNFSLFQKHSTAMDVFQTLG